MTQAEAEKQGLSVEVKKANTEGWYSSRRIGYGHTGFKTVVEASTGKILGATVMTHGAEELINVLAVAIKMGATVEDLKSMVWTFPTSSADLPYYF